VACRKGAILKLPGALAPSEVGEAGTPYRLARRKFGGRQRAMLFRVLRQVPLALMALGILFPVYFMVANSLKSDTAFASNALSPPMSPTLRKYVDAFRTANLSTYFLNSLIISVTSVAIATLCAAFAAFALAKMRFRGREVIFRVMLPMMAVPSIVLLVPQFRLMSRVGLVDNRWSVIIIYVGIMLPFSIYLLRSFFLAFPSELLDAAAIDGAGLLRTFFRIVLAGSRPAIVTTVIVNFVFAWNELLLALVFLQSQRQRTLVVGLTIFNSLYTLDVPKLMAGMTLATIPVVVVYLVGQRYLLRSLSGMGR
jgi:ABC-type glycerol-3-phosphate transport system permease component